jgi:hypothetical protein
MKRILLTTVSLGVLGLMSPAFGADLPTYSKAPVYAAPVYDWSGFYVGVFGGGGYGNHNVNDAFGNTGNANFTANYSSTGARPATTGRAAVTWSVSKAIFSGPASRATMQVRLLRVPFQSSRSIRIICVGAGRSGYAAASPSTAG